MDHKKQHRVIRSKLASHLDHVSNLLGFHLFVEVLVLADLTVKALSHDYALLGVVAVYILARGLMLRA